MSAKGGQAFDSSILTFNAMAKIFRTGFDRTLDVYRRTHVQTLKSYSGGELTLIVTIRIPSFIRRCAPGPTL